MRRADIIADPLNRIITLPRNSQHSLRNIDANNAALISLATQLSCTRHSYCASSTPEFEQRFGTASNQALVKTDHVYSIDIEQHVLIGRFVERFSVNHRPDSHQQAILR